jgi:tetratricopeptide (TPR) repeat protein
MPVRWGTLLFLVCLGCHSVGLPPDLGQTASTNLPTQFPTTPETPRAEAVAPTKSSPSHLRLAATALEEGRDELACQHLSLFLKDNPGHRNARYYHAELLLKLKRLTAARTEFELAIADAQEDLALDWQHLVHCHGRLVEIGTTLEDDFAEHLHRGIGLLLLAEQRAGLAEPEGDFPTEAMLCRALAELQAARTHQPQEARVHWYLHRVWRQLGQDQAAGKALRQTQAQAMFSQLTPAEQRGVELASRRLALRGPLSSGVE